MAKVRGAHDQEDLAFAAAIVAQQIGHSYEDLAAVLAALTCRHSPQHTFKGAPKDRETAKQSVYFTLVKYAGTLSIEDVLGSVTAGGLAKQCGFDVLAQSRLPAQFVRGAGRWLLDGISHYVAALGRRNLVQLGVTFRKLKHGAVVVHESTILSKQLPRGHLGILVPGSTRGAPKVFAIPATRKFIADAVAEIDRVRLSINVVLALYLNTYHATIWRIAPFGEMLDPRAREAIGGPCLIGAHFDVLRAVPPSSFL